MTDIPVNICDSGQHAASESSHDVNYRDSESKSGVKSFDVDDSKIPPAAFADETVKVLCDKLAVKSMYEEQKSIEGREDSPSCVTGGSEANRLASSNIVCVGLRHGLDELSSPKKESIEFFCSEEKNGVGHCINGKGHSMALEEACLKVEGEVNTGSTVDCEKVGLKLEPEIQANIVTENKANKVDNSSAQNNEIENVESCELVRLQEINVESRPMIDSYESDPLEHDVKVCDICGDAGLEDLLAICSKCSDGAEHTYCMCEMLHKVPEGDWLCEECKSLDEIKSRDAVVPVAATDKHQSSEAASAEDTDLLLNADTKEIHAEATRPRKKILGKRDIDDKPVEDVITSVLAKKQALGSTVGSPKGTHGVASLSRDSSFKNLNKGEEKPHQSSNSQTLVDPSSGRGLRHQESRGHLSKSSSFSTNPKSNGEFFSEASQKQKVARESAHLDKKEGASKFIGRSTSFKPLTLSRLNRSESRVKMLSPKFSHPHDVKGARQAKAQSILERKSSFKPEHQLSNARINSSPASASNSDQKLTSTDSSVSNDGEPKGVPSDNKPSRLSKSTSFIARKGELKINSDPDQRPKEAGLKDDSPSGNYIAEKPFSNSRGRSQETERPSEKTKDSCVSRYRTNIVNDASTARSSADVIKGNKLKAAIEAAMLKKPGICRKNKPADQSDEVSRPSSNLNCETRPEEPLSTSSRRSNVSSSYEVHENQATSNNGNQTSIPLGAASLKSGENCLLVPSATVSILSKMPVLPEHEYIWQGGFDIRKIGKLADLRDGLQAHLSTCASPKVFEVVNKFPSKVLLNEVPRSSTWPVQFREAGVKEDNIALYFFAKDLESYERSYKFLLENMMRRDLALKGNFDGVELLIFPSNHLPKKAQCWNMLYFLWGVFRGKKANCVQNLTDSYARNASQASVGPAITDFRGISRNVTTDGNNSATLVLECRTSDNVIAVRDTRVSLGDSNDQCLQGNAEKQDLRVDAKRVRGVPVPEIKGTTSPMEENVEPKTKTKPDLQDAETNPPNAQKSSSSFGSSARATLEMTVKKEEESNESQFSNGKRLREAPIQETLIPTIANKKQKTDSADDNMFPKMVSSSGHPLEEELKAPKRGIILDLNETQDYSPEGPSPAAKQEKGRLFDLNVAQDEEVDDSPLFFDGLSKR